jgi:hypothetical protein
LKIKVFIAQSSWNKSAVNNTVARISFVTFISVFELIFARTEVSAKASIVVQCNVGV